MLLLILIALSSAVAADDEQCVNEEQCGTSSLEGQLDQLLATQHREYCASRLRLVRQAEKLPQRVAYPVLQDKLITKNFPVERSWREHFSNAGYQQTSSVLSATYIIAKSARVNLLPYGGVCGDTQMFNHIQGQEVWTDKVNATLLLRAKGQAHTQPTTMVFDKASTELEQLDAELKAWEAMSEAVRPPANAVAFIHKRRGRENSKGITLLTWKELKHRRNQDSQGRVKPLVDFLVPGVLQRYLDPPLLLGGHKTDLRCFILIASVKPFAAFFHKDWFARRSPESYSPRETDPDKGALTAAAHLKLPEGESDEKALMQAQLPPSEMAAVLHGEDRLGGKAPEAWLRSIFVPRLKHLSSRMVHAVADSLSTEKGYFAVYGLDVLVDAEFNIYFSEMNFSPQLSDVGSSPWKKDMSRQLVKEMIDLEEAVLQARALPEQSGGEEKLIQELRDRAVDFSPLALEEREGVRWYHELPEGDDM